MRIFPQNTSVIFMKNVFPWKGLPEMTNGKKGLYASRLENQRLYYDAVAGKIYYES